MTLYRASELGFVLCMSFALLALLLGGELPVAAWVSLPMPALSAWLRLRKMTLPASVGTATAIGGAILGMLMVLAQGLDTLVISASVALIIVLCARLLTRTSDRHTIQAILISLLLVLAASVLHLRMSYGVVLFCYAICVVWALLTRQLVVGATREEERGGAPAEVTLARRDVITVGYLGGTAAIAVGLMLCTTLLFITFPRVGIGRFGFAGQQGSALPTEVSLFTTPRAAGSDAVVARVTGLKERDFRQGLYLRGPVYSTLTPEGFTQPMERSFAAPNTWGSLAHNDDWRRYEVFLKPLGSELLLTLGSSKRGRIVAGANTGFVQRLRVSSVGPAGELYASRPVNSPIRYAVLGTLSASTNTVPREVSPGKLDPFLQLPKNFDPRISALANRVTSNTQGIESKVAKLRLYFQDFSYTLNTPAATSERPLSEFLFTHRTGHCEYFATTLAAMLRVAGIPSRVVGGFQGGRWDPQGNVAVFSQRDAHAWVEWFDPTRGWRIVDATPAGAGGMEFFTGLGAWLERAQRFWDDHVIDYDLGQQLELLQTLSEPFKNPATAESMQVNWRQWARWGLGVFAAALVGLVGLVIARRRRRHAKGKLLIIEALDRAHRALIGEPPEQHDTGREMVMHMLDRVPGNEQLALTLQRTLMLHEAIDFGGASDGANAPAVGHALKALRQQLRDYSNANRRV